MRYTKTTLVLIGSLAVASCATKRETGAATGAIGGAAVGGLVGGKTGALVGVALGGLLGYEAGRQLEERDRERVLYSLEHDRRMQWENDRTGDHYDVQPTDTFYRQGRECRDFRMIAEVDYDRQEVHGTACRTPSGDWELLQG